MLSAVPSFASELLKPLGPPEGLIGTYADVHLQDGAGLPATTGTIVISSAKARWSCLMATKTDAEKFDPEQIGRYLEVARQHHLNALLTVSNQSDDDRDWQSAAELDTSELMNFRIAHLSWWKVLYEAVMQHRFRGVDGSNQAAILADLIYYLTDEEHGP